MCPEGLMFCNFLKLMRVLSPGFLERRRKFGIIGSMFRESRNFQRLKCREGCGRERAFVLPESSLVGVSDKPTSCRTDVGEILQTAEIVKKRRAVGVADR